MKKVKNKTKGMDLATGLISNHGITLIALIITIIVLIILASVVINLSLLNNGIFDRAKQARNLTNKQEATDRINLKILTAQANKYAENQEMLTLKELSETLKEDEEIQYITETSKVASVEYNVPSENPTSIYVKLKEYSYEFEINSQLKLAKIDGKEVVDSNQQNNNQKPGGDDQAGIKPGESGYAGGSYNDPYIPKGFKHVGEDTWNSGYTIIGDIVSEGNEFVWVPCVLTEEEQQAAQTNGDTVQIFQKTTSGGDFNRGKFGLLPEDESVPPEDQGAMAIEESVGEYGGFYIAKYEAGIPNSSSVYYNDHGTSVSGDVLPVSKPNVAPWNFIGRMDAINLSKKMINNEKTGVHSTLISGAAWDTTVQWICNTVDRGFAGSGSGRGNDSASPAVTSSNFNAAYSRNNIYDMVKNLEEFTTENCKNSNAIMCAVVRGDYYSGYFGAAYRSAAGKWDDNRGGSSRGFRVAIYK